MCRNTTTEFLNVFFHLMKGEKVVAGLLKMFPGKARSRLFIEIGGLIVMNLLPRKVYASMRMWKLLYRFY